MRVGIFLLAVGSGSLACSDLQGVGLCVSEKV